VPQSDYYALVYLRGCGELIQQGDIEVDESDPDVLTVTVRVFKPEKAEVTGPLHLLPVDDPRHRCVQGLCDDHAGPS